MEGSMSEQLTCDLSIAIESLGDYTTDDPALAAWIASTRDALLALQCHLEEIAPPEEVDLEDTARLRAIR
jgi:hypothetical protein